jgi:hypothetical protein
MDKLARQAKQMLRRTFDGVDRFSGRAKTFVRLDA